jgi:hypothetical protein
MASRFRNYSGSVSILACAPLSDERQQDANFSLEQLRDFI